MGPSSSPRMVCLCIILLLCGSRPCSAGITSRYVRKLAWSVDLLEDDPHLKAPEGYNAPQQVHIHQGDYEGRAVIISWVTQDEPGDSRVFYGQKQGGQYTTSVTGETYSYSFYNYTSGSIHHAVITDLEFDTKYFYTLGTGQVSREFWFTTPPESKLDTTYTFGVIGDLGQTSDSLSTLEHYMNGTGRSVLFVGDLSYADVYPFHNNIRWDTWCRLIQPSTAYQPWIWTAGNHELDFLPEVGETIPFKPYTHRFHTPFRASDSTSPLWYSIKRGPATIIVLSSYSAYGMYTPQYRWLVAALKRVDRRVTPWLIVLMHAPLYNSNSDHYYEGEPMRVIFEPFFVDYKVDIVFAGHVHAYERTDYSCFSCGCNVSTDKEGALPIYPPMALLDSTRDVIGPHTILRENYYPTFRSIRLQSPHIEPYLAQYPVSNVKYDILNGQCTPQINETAPVYVVIGDGGNIEGLSGPSSRPIANYSAFRESSFGHGIFDIQNHTHALFTWHRNHDGVKEAADSAVILNNFWP